MRIPAVVLCLALAATMAACGTETADSASSKDRSGSDPAASGPGPMPTEVPAATGVVTTRQLAVVMDDGATVELCLGPVAESYPPQCGGPELRGWDWQKLGQGMHERQGRIRWGSFSVTGTWDGTTFTARGAVPAALYDAMLPEPTPTPTPARTYAEGELAEVAEEVGKLPGAQGAYAADGHVVVDVVFDDGSLQAWADEAYGANVVLVNSALVPA